jgi:uncharacterized linocin/CFP29 family protein
MPEYLLDGAAHGSMAQRLLQSNMDPGAMRPFIGKDGRTYITLNAGRKNKKPVNRLTTNATAVLQDQEWRLIDRAIHEAARPRMNLWNDLRGAVTPFTISNGMNFSVVTHQASSLGTRAKLSMDGIVRGRQDRPTMDLRGLPLPIVSKEFSLTTREIAVSRQMGTDLDVGPVTEAAIMCAEEIERIVSGTESAYAYGGYSVYGYMNFPNRITGSFTDPTGGTWTPDTMRNEVLAMLQALNNAKQHGTFRLYYSNDLMQYMLRRYSDYDSTSLAEVLLRIPQISSVQQADFIPGQELILVQNQVTTAQAVVGMELQTIQWEEQGGLEQVFKVMGILVPRLRADKYNNCGIAHYTGA